MTRGKAVKGSIFQCNHEVEGHMTSLRSKIRIIFGFSTMSVHIYHNASLRCVNYTTDVSNHYMYFDLGAEGDRQMCKVALVVT